MARRRRASRNARRADGAARRGRKPRRARRAGQSPSTRAGGAAGGRADVLVADAAIANATARAQAACATSPATRPGGRDADRRRERGQEIGLLLHDRATTRRAPEEDQYFLKTPLGPPPRVRPGPQTGRLKPPVVARSRAAGTRPDRRAGRRVEGPRRSAGARSRGPRPAAAHLFPRNLKIITRSPRGRRGVHRGQRGAATSTAAAAPWSARSDTASRKSPRHDGAGAPPAFAHSSQFISRETMELSAASPPRPGRHEETGRAHRLRRQRAVETATGLARQYQSRRPPVEAQGDHPLAVVSRQHAGRPCRYRQRGAARIYRR